MEATEKTGWILYGATGYTGRLLAREAVRRGHAPLLAGRSPEKLAPLAAELGLPWQAVDLADPAGLRRLLGGGKVVLHAAGPYLQTAAPMRQSCLETGCHYLDITGEIPVFQATFALDGQARQAGVALISGVGLDVVPSDCLAVYLAGRLPGADELELYIAAVTQPSAGTVKSGLGMLASGETSGGGLVRRAGQLQPWPLGEGARQVRFSDRERWAVPAPWGDLVTAHHSTGIPNLTTYLAYPPRLYPWMRRVRRLAGLLRVGFVRRLAAALVERLVKGPDEHTLQTGRSHFYGVARRPDGQTVQAWLDTGEAYDLTARTGVRAVEKLLQEPRVGALSPAQAFGADFILEIEKTRRLDHLE
jgi:short subunit dehydrogenase-like uncharacterized protein